MKKLMKKLFRTQAGRFIAGLLALIVAVAVVIGAGCMNFLKADVTAKRVMTIDPAAAEIARAIDEEVHISYLTTESDRNIWLDELLGKYAAINGNIKYDSFDPSMEGSYLVFSSDKRSMTVNCEDLYKITYDMFEYYYYGELIEESRIFAADEEIANALRYITRDDMPVVYLLGGHGETSPGTLALEELWRNNIDVQNLVLSGAVPQDAALVMICAPKTDLTQEEAKALLDYLKNGGKLVLLTDYTMVSAPNLGMVTAYYGMQAKYGLVLDVTKDYCYSAELPNYLVPAVAEHDFTAALTASGADLLMPMCSAIERSETVRDTLTVTELMTTSAEAYVKNPLAMTTVEKEDGDEVGTFTLAMAAQEGDTRIVWIAGTDFIENENVQYSGENNLYLMDGIRAWMLPETPQRISVADENLIASAAGVAQEQKVVVCIALFAPVLAVLIAGIVLCGRQGRRRVEE